MRQPERYTNGTDKVCHLLKTLYRLRQSGREWDNEFNKCMQSIGFKKLLSNPYAYLCRSKDDFQIITVWVDDLLIFTNSNAGMHNVKLQIAQQWKVKDLGKLAKIIGIEIKHTHNTISISQKKYIETILKKEGMEHANPVATPLDANVTIEPNPDHFEGSATTTYAQLLAEIQYIANAT